MSGPSFSPRPPVFAQPASPANCSRKYVARASLFVGPLTGGSSCSEGVGSASPEILIFTLPLCNTLCMSWERRCSPILGVPTQWVNANDFCDRIGLSGARIFFDLRGLAGERGEIFLGFFHSLAWRIRVEFHPNFYLFANIHHRQIDGLAIRNFRHNVDCSGGDHAFLLLRRIHHGKYCYCCDICCRC